SKAIIKHFPTSFNRYFEPMIGGGALLLETRPEKATISDLNYELINLWRTVRDYPHLLIEQLKKHQANHSEAYFYKARKVFNELKVKKEVSTQIQRAGLFLYLNKTCFNGL